MTQAIIEADIEFGVIRKTGDYSKFMYMGGNRSVDIKHVKELETQMQRDRQLFASLPILVNENWYIVDGQHRYEAAKNLGLPVYYIMQKGANLTDARQLNIAQKRWRMMDFARSYADSGRQDYIDLLRINDNYPRIPLSMVVDYLGYNRKHDDSFQRGEFQILDLQDGIDCLDVLAEIVDILNRPADSSFSSALWKLLHTEQFDGYTFIRKLKENPDALVMATSVRANLRNIEEIYNRHNKIAIRLY